MFLPFRWVAGNERGEKSYVAAILCCAARANLEGVASCSTTLSSPPARAPPPPFPPSRPPPRRILRRAISSYPPVTPPSPPPSSSRRPRFCSPCQTHEPIDCRFCIICQDPNSLMHVPLRRHLTPPSVPFLYSPVTYSAVGVFFNNERNVSSTSNSFTAKNDLPRSDTKIDVVENNRRQNNEI